MSLTSVRTATTATGSSRRSGETKGADGAVVIDLLLIGLVVTLFPLPVMAFALVLASPRGARKGLAFILAWLACLVAVTAAVLLLTDGQPPPPRSPPSVAALVATLLIGAGLVVHGERRRRRNRRATRAPARAGAPTAPASGSSAPSAESPGEGVTVRSAVLLAVLLQPWGMVGAAAATIVQADLSRGTSFAALAFFCLLATSTLLAMELYVVLSPERARRTLLGLRERLLRHKEPAVVLLCLLLGLWLVGRSLWLIADRCGPAAMRMQDVGGPAVHRWSPKAAPWTRSDSSGAQRMLPAAEEPYR
ncbi:GAP family protein [Streptomyces sp. NPDC058700]|uniref:GAP family protein n=1 Tax=Streptomyces sp. NPDC058700 TaxID=3346607 RepID=UPI003655B453